MAKYDDSEHENYAGIISYINKKFSVEIGYNKNQRAMGEITEKEFKALINARERARSELKKSQYRGFTNALNRLGLVSRGKDVAADVKNKILYTPAGRLRKDIPKNVEDFEYMAAKAMGINGEEYDELRKEIIIKSASKLALGEATVVGYKETYKDMKNEKELEDKLAKFNKFLTKIKKDKNIIYEDDRNSLHRLFAKEYNKTKEKIGRPSSVTFMIEGKSGTYGGERLLKEIDKATAEGREIPKIKIIKKVGYKLNNEDTYQIISNLKSKITANRGKLVTIDNKTLTAAEAELGFAKEVAAGGDPNELIKKYVMSKPRPKLTGEEKYALDKLAKMKDKISRALYKIEEINSAQEFSGLGTKFTTDLSKKEMTPKEFQEVFKRINQEYNVKIDSIKRYKQALKEMDRQEWRLKQISLNDKIIKTGEEITNLQTKINEGVPNVDELLDKQKKAMDTEKMLKAQLKKNKPVVKAVEKMPKTIIGRLGEIDKLDYKDINLILKGVSKTRKRKEKQTDLGRFGVNIKGYQNAGIKI